MSIQNQQGVPLVSVVMPVWNKEAETLALCLKALESLRMYTRVPYELIVVDNASPAHQEPVSRQQFFMEVARHKKAEIITHATNLGFGVAVNRGAAGAKGKFLCQMNSDCELVEDSIAILLSFMLQFKVDVGMPEHFENCAHYGLQKTHEKMTDWRFGAFWIMATALFREMEGFDPAFEQCYWEDFDLWRRMEASGKSIHGYRGTWVKHKGGASSLPNRDEIFLRNKKRFDERWGTSREVN